MSDRKQYIEQLRNLADAIEKGCGMRPNDATGVFFLGETYSCALGAAYEGEFVYGVDDNWDSRDVLRAETIRLKLYDAFPVLLSYEFDLLHPEFSDGGRDSLYDQIVNYNDRRDRFHLSRKEIVENLRECATCAELE